MSDHAEHPSQSTESDSPDKLAPEADAHAGKKALGAASGLLAWMTKNSVAANILMFFLLIFGAMRTCDMKKEVFPEFQIDQIFINVAYPGASPEEVEQGVILAIEENIRGIDGIKDIRSTASENIGVVTVSLLLGTDTSQALNDIKAAVDRVTSFPEDIERPVVFLPSFRNQVLSLAVYGDHDPRSLKAIAERVRLELLQDPNISVVEVSGLPALEISIEISQDNLRRYGLTIDEVAGIVKQASIELPGGVVKAKGGEILLRTTERRETGEEFADIIVRALPDGSKVRLGDIADIKDGFAETDQLATFNGKRAVMLNIFRVGKQTPVQVSDAIYKYMDEQGHKLPPGVDLGVWVDTSEWYEGRMDLLYRNAWLGLVLVLIILGLFLEMKLAFWVTMGIPISFIGALVYIGSTDVSINMLSMFAFIVVLGMVVDDAIVVGEVVYAKREQGMPRLQAAIAGVKEVAGPVTFAIITTVMAYMPMLFVPGIMGKFFRVIPIVVITVLLMSLVESLLILPAHLAHSSPTGRRGIFGFISRGQQRVSRWLTRSIQYFYIPVITAAAKRRYLTLCASLAIFIGSIGIIAGGRIDFVFFPQVEGDFIIVETQMPYGTSIERTRQVQNHIQNQALEVMDRHGGARIKRAMFSNLGAAGLTRNDPGRPATGGTHLCEVAIYLVPMDDRSVTTEQFVREWREAVGDVPGVERMTFTFGTGPTSKAIDIELRHTDMNRLNEAAAELGGRLREFAGVYDINDGLEDGKQQIDLELRPEARALGLNELMLARQIRSAFFGAEAVRQQRGRDEQRVYVRLPREERESEYNIEELIIRTPLGTEIPLSQAAIVNRGVSYTSIRRINGARAISITAEVDTAVNNGNQIMDEITRDVKPGFLRKYPGLEFGFGSGAMDERESMSALGNGFLIALVGMYALLAVAFKSYVQPIVVLLAIPFGIVGAIFGHLLLGFDMSMMSMMGAVALSGVVINDSLILIVAVNRLREAGHSALDAIIEGSTMRFRPILLTSLTTFFGLAPMLLETSVQARFLIPMAISLAFGVMFATFITLLLVPAAYLIVDDVKERLGAWYRWLMPGAGMVAVASGDAHYEVDDSDFEVS